MTKLFKQEAEQFVLGALLIDNNQLDKIPELEAKHFYVSSHQHIYKAIHALVSNGGIADVITLSDFDRQLNMQYLHELSSNAYTTANIEHHAKIIRGEYTKREVLTAAHAIISDLGIHTPDQVVQNALIALDEITKTQSKQESVPLQDLALQYIEYVDRVQSGSEEFKALKTGLEKVDERLGGGFIGGDLVIIAGRPGSGKTSALGTIMQNNLETAGGFASLEMTGQQMAMRIIAGAGKIDGTKLRSASIDGDDWTHVTHAIQKISKSNLHIIDQSNMSLFDIQAEARRLKRIHDIEYYAVDYLQIMDIGDDDENIGFGKITKALKNLAKELDIPIFLLSQFNRGSNQRGDQKPRLADLRGSGSIEQDADVVMAPHHDPNQPDKPTELLFLKNRAGSKESVFVTFVGRYYRFESFYGNHEPDQPKQKGYQPNAMY